MEQLRTKLSDRLLMVASLVKKGEKVADIGTDHAYLSAYLVTKGISPKAIASDVAEGPLKNAEKIVINAKLNDYITLRLSDGLDNISPDEADTFIFAGMGGTLITSLIERTPWVKTNGKRFVFQPMSHSEDVIEFLINNGFEIEEQKSCFDEKRCYTAFSAVYTGEKKNYPPAFLYVGLLTSQDSDSSRFFIEKQYRHLKKRYDALTKADIKEDERNKLKEILDKIKF